MSVIIITCQLSIFNNDHYYSILQKAKNEEEYFCLLTGIKSQIQDLHRVLCVIQAALALSRTSGQASSNPFLTLDLTGSLTLVNSDPGLFIVIEIASRQRVGSVVFVAVTTCATFS